jgi:hypothetical protein
MTGFGIDFSEWTQGCSFKTEDCRIRINPKQDVSRNNSFPSPLGEGQGCGIIGQWLGIIYNENE